MLLTYQLCTIAALASGLVLAVFDMSLQRARIALLDARH